MVANRLGLQIGGSVSGDKIVVPDVREYMQYLGFRPGDKDCKSAGNRGYFDVLSSRRYFFERRDKFLI